MAGMEGCAKQRPHAAPMGTRPAQTKPLDPIMP